MLQTPRRGQDQQGDFHQVYSLNPDHMHERTQVKCISQKCTFHSGDRLFINPQHIFMSQSSNFQEDKSTFLKLSPLKFSLTSNLHMTLHRALMTLLCSPSSINPPHYSPLSPNTQPPSEPLSLSPTLLTLPYGASNLCCGPSFSSCMVFIPLIPWSHFTWHHHNFQISHSSPIVTH